MLYFPFLFVTSVTNLFVSERAKDRLKMCLLQLRSFPRKVPYRYQVLSELKYRCKLILNYSLFVSVLMLIESLLAMIYTDQSISLVITCLWIDPKS